MKKYFAISAIVITNLLNSCGTLPTNTITKNFGEITVRTWVNHSLSKKSAVTQTTWDSLKITVTGADISPIKKYVKFDENNEFTIVTLENIPVGINRIVQAWTINNSGDTIHYASDTIESIDAGETVPVVLDLKPLRGSIYINLADVPKTVDSVKATFIHEGDTLKTSAQRNALMYMCIDNIPNGAQGILSIIGVDTNGAILYNNSTNITFSSLNNKTLQANFSATNGIISLSISVNRPGITVISGSVSKQTITEEKGPFVISEIMYYAEGDSDYIELTNPTEQCITIDTMILEIINTNSTTKKYIQNITLSPSQKFVIGDMDCPTTWSDTNVAMDLTTTGRWIILKQKDGTIIDQVSYTKTNQEWPTPQKFESIELDSSSITPLKNNYGSNWFVSTNPIGDSLYYGSPKY